MPVKRMLKRESSETIKAIGREKQAQMHALLRKLVLKVGHRKYSACTLPAIRSHRPHNTLEARYPLGPW
jgi:hypothetical protein